MMTCTRSERAPHAGFRRCVLMALIVFAMYEPPVADAQAVTLTQVGTIPGPVEHVRVQGNFAYVSRHTDFTIWDVSNPASPTRQGTVQMPEEIWGFRVRGDRAFVGANFSGVAIVDISDPTAPRVLSNHKTLGQAKIGAVYENRVVLIDHMEGMVMVDISDEAAPAGAGSFFLDGYARDVVTSGRMAYATDSPTGCMCSICPDRANRTRWECSMRQRRRVLLRCSVRLESRPASSRERVGVTCRSTMRQTRWHP